MRLSTKLSGIVAVGGVAALGAGLISSGGIGAVFSHSASADATLGVGTFNCALSSSDSDVKISKPGPDSGDKASVDFGTITSSARGSKTAPLTLTNEGSIPLVAEWTTAPSQTLANANINTIKAPTSSLLLPTGFGDDLSSQATNIGFMWDTLTPAALNKSGTSTYSVTCREIVPGEYVTYANNGGTVSGNSTDGFAITTAVPPKGTAATMWQDGFALGVSGDQPLPKLRPGFTMSNDATLGTVAGAARINITLSNAQGDVKYVGIFPTNDPVSANAGWNTFNVGNDWAAITSAADGYTVKDVRVAMYSNPGDTTQIGGTVSCFRYAESAFGSNC